MNSKNLESKINDAADMIVGSKRIVVFTGAGVSTESGIPDFRSRGGIWAKFDPDDFTIQKFKNNEEARKKHWKVLVEGGLITNAMPNKAHYAIADLEKLKKLTCVITQNIDNLHQKAGNSTEKIFELHGNMQWVTCLHCGEQYALGHILEKLKKGAENPHCEKCQGILKPNIVFFGEELSEGTMESAINCTIKSDLFIVIGSSLVVYPAAYMPEYAKNTGAKIVIINMSPTNFDDRADILIRGKAGRIMDMILEKIKAKLN